MTTPYTFLRAPLAIALMATASAGCGALQDRSDLQIRVIDARNNQPVNGAVVEVEYLTQRTGPSGTTRFQLRSRSYEVGIEHPAYLPLTTTVVLYGGLVSKTVALYPRPDGPPGPGPMPTPTPNPGGSGQPTPPPGPTPSPGADNTVAVFGRVADAQGNRLAGTSIMVESSWGIPIGTQTTGANGEYRIAKVPRGAQVRVIAFKEGFTAVSRPITPGGDWRLDFTGAFALRPAIAPLPTPGGPVPVTAKGDVEDTMGRPIDGAFVRVESADARYPFSASAITRHGRYSVRVIAGLPLRFTASKVDHRTVTFTQKLEMPSFGDTVAVDFTGVRALDPTPILEGR